MSQEWRSIVFHLKDTLESLVLRGLVAHDAYEHRYDLPGETPTFKRGCLRCKAPELIKEADKLLDSK